MLRSPSGQRLAAAGLEGVRIELVYPCNPRTALSQGPDHLAFWQGLLERVGVKPIVTYR